MGINGTLCRTPPNAEDFEQNAIYGRYLRRRLVAALPCPSNAAGPFAFSQECRCGRRRPSSLLIPDRCGIPCRPPLLRCRSSSLSVLPRALSRLPKPYGDYLILDILKKSQGTAVAATDAEI